MRRKRQQKYVAFTQAKKQLAINKWHVRLEKSKKHILNLSNYPLNDDEIQILGRGIKFIPSRKFKPITLMRDFISFEKKLRWKYLFHVNPQMRKNENNNYLKKFSLKSNEIPPLAGKAIEDYILAVKMDISNLPECNSIKNLSIKEKRALENLKNNKDIVISKADKGSSCVIWSKANYLQEGEKQLSGVHYNPIETLNTKEIWQQIKCVQDNLFDRGIIPEKIYDYLNEKRQFSIPNFYLLPKIHKIKNVLDTIDPVQQNGNIVVPGRPIIAQNGGVRERIGQYIDFFLLPIVKSSRWYIKDTGELIKLIENLKLPDSIVLGSYDISSMYTNMVYSEILSSVENAYDNREHTYCIPKPPKKDLLKLLEICISNNEFEFNGKYYKQVIGVAMGASESPECSDIRKFDLLNEIESNYRHKNKILFHKSFRDDGIIILNGTKEELNEFFTIANRSHRLLKFTFELSDTHLTFLDLLIKKGKRFEESKILDIEVSFKQTDSFQYLDPTSNHPDNCFRGLIKGELLRYLRNTSDRDKFEEVKSNFHTRLLDRGYNENHVTHQLNKVKFSERNDSLSMANTADKGNGEIPLCLVTKFNKNAPNVKRILMKHWHLIQNSDSCKHIFKTEPIVAYSRFKNLKEILKNKV